MIDLKTNFTGKELLEQLDDVEVKWSRLAMKTTMKVMGEEVVKEMSIQAPLRSGKLKKSFGYKLKRITKRDGDGYFTSTQDYAQFINDGTNSSEGGFIPAIERRLSKRYMKKNNVRSEKLRKHPGVRATQYQERARDKVDEKIVKKLMKVLKQKGFLANTKGDVA